MNTDTPDQATPRQGDDLFQRAVGALMSAQAGRRKTVLYDARGNVLPPSATYQYKRTAAKREGSLQNWIPRRLLSRQQESMERERIVERSIDLVNNDPHAAGIVDSFATTIVGAGLRPHPALDADVLGMEKEEVRTLQAAQRAVYDAWSPTADAGGRMTDAGIQFLLQCCMLRFGEYLVLLPMLKDAARPYSLAVQVIHPLRLKTPTDLASDPKIRDGVEMGDYGQPVAYWIKKAPGSAAYTPDTSSNFLRIPAKKGHRWNVIHRFIQDDPDKVRGLPFFAPAMKFFRDLNDYLDAELVANVVTAAYALFIETGDADAWDIADNMMHHDNAETGVDQIRYEEIIPGSVMYGEKGQKPHSLGNTRPGNTFQVFVKEIKKALAMSLDMPYVTLFKDVEETNYAGMRSAMLDAWRVFSHRRAWLGDSYCNPVRTMLLEEAWLRGHFDAADFYDRMQFYCTCRWVGSPKGNIEPIKEIQADILAIKNKLKARAQSIGEQYGGEWRATFDQLEEEESELEARGLSADLDEQASVKEEKTDESD